MGALKTDPAPTPQQVRRALTRAERGAVLDVAEAAVLLATRGEDLDRLAAVAARVRDAGLVAVGRSGVVTFSPKVFIPVTRLCRDRCHYCTFVETPGQAARADFEMIRDAGFVLEAPDGSAVDGARLDELLAAASGVNSNCRTSDGCGH